MKHFQITYKLRQFLIPKLLRTQKISMHLPFIVIFCLSFWTRLCYNLTASIDLNSTYTFSSALIKSQTLTLNGQEVVLILFSNGSISKLNDQLVFQQSISIGSNISIVDFQISACLNCTAYTPSIIAVHSQKQNFTVISLLNTTYRILLTGTWVLTKLFPLNTQINSSYAYSIEIIYFTSNQLQHYRYVNGSSTRRFSDSFTYYSTNDPVVNIARYEQYFLFFTKYNYVNLYDANSLSIINSTHIGIFDLQAVFTDYPYVGLTQKMNSYLGISVTGSSFTNSSILLTDATLSSRISSSSSYLKFIRPSPSALALTPTSERIFIFHNQMMKVNMSSGYAYISVLNNALNFSSSSNISVVFFQSSKIGFIHSSNDNKAYSYCQNITGTSCTNTLTLCSQFDPNCRTCNSTSCMSCFTSYNLVNGTCQPQCNITNCAVCDTLLTCRTCTSGYSLNSNSTNCTLIIANTTTNITITDNTTITTITNTTTNTTTINSTDNSTNITDTTNTTTNQTNTTTNSTTDNTTNTTNSTNTTDTQNTTNTTNPAVPDQTTNSTTDITTNTTTNTTTNPNTNQTNIPAPTNTTNTTTTDPSTIQTQKTSPPTSPFTEPASQQAITTIYSSFTPQTKSLVTTTSFLNSSPFYRLILAFLSPIFGLFDDYWFYIYHNNSFDHLVLFPRLLVFMYVVNQQRIIPDFLQETINNCGIPQFISAQDSYKNYTSPRVLLIDQKPTFMQENFRQLLLGQWVLLILMLSLVKIITVFLKKWLKSSSEKSNFSQQNFKIMKTQTTCYKRHASIAPDKCRTILKVFTEYLRQSISFKNILLCLLGSNLIFVSFQLGTQFQIFFSLVSVDKINLIISLLLGLIFMIAFLVLVTLNQPLFEKVSHSDKKLTKKQKINKKYLKKVWHQDMEKVIFHCIKSCLYGFVHGYLLENNQFQYLMLILVKIVLLILICKYPSLFKHSKLAKLTMVYFVMGICMDILCLVGKLNLFHSSILSTVFILHGQQVTILLIIQSCLLFIMFFSIISLVVVQLYYELKHMLCLPSKSNKICNMSTMASSKPQTIFEVIQKVEQYENAYQTPENQKIDLRKIQKFRRKVFVKDQTINGQRLRKNDTDEDEAVIVKNKTAIGRVKKAIFAPNLIQSSAKPIFDSVDDQPLPTQANSNFHSSFHKARSFHRRPYPQLKSLKQSSLLTVTHFKK